MTEPIQITLTGKTPDGKVVCQETVSNSNEAAKITKQWTEACLTVERKNNGEKE